jgi:putative oxidoreductase
MAFNQVQTSSGWGATALRLAVGVVFLMHGGQKWFVYGLHNTSAAMGQMGMPVPAVTGILITFLEFFGGLALILGLCTRWAAVLFVVEMLVAVLAVHFRNGFFLPHGFEYAFMMLAASLALALEGSGKASLDRVLFRHG